MECEEFGFGIFDEIPCNYICDLLNREIDLF
jgi:hypothetical protein